MQSGNKNAIMVNIGFGNVVAAGRVISILSPASAPMKRLREEARDMHLLVDATEGRRTRSIIVTDSGHIILSGLSTETLVQRINDPS
ncbi:MAG: DUF370 domain-containing protein [Nitrospirae bacterium]|nr:DUF370 domain-containing protein [Nitrospirota bacterium]